MQWQSREHIYIEEAGMQTVLSLRRHTTYLQQKPINDSLGSEKRREWSVGGKQECLLGRLGAGGIRMLAIIKADVSCVIL